MLRVHARRARSGVARCFLPGTTLRLQLLDDHADADKETILVVRLLKVILPRRQPRSKESSEASRSRRRIVSAAFELEHDPAAALFFLSGEPLDLTRLGYRLLCFLVKHPGQLLEHQQILDAVWPGPLDSDTPALRSCICRLRGRLGAAGRLIQTERPSAFRFIPEPGAT